MGQSLPFRGFQLRDRCLVKYLHDILLRTRSGEILLTCGMRKIPFDVHSLDAAQIFASIKIAPEQFVKYKTLRITF